MIQVQNYCYLCREAPHLKNSKLLQCHLLKNYSFLNIFLNYLFYVYVYLPSGMVVYHL